MMKTSALNDFSLQTADFSSLDNLPDLAFVNEHFAMMLNIGPYRNNFIHVGEPYRFVEGRILWVMEGGADFELTLEEYHIKKGDIIQLPPETIMELKSCSDDFTMMGIIFKENIPVGKSLIVHAGEQEWQETVGLANILWNIARRTPFRLETVNHIVSAIISDIQDISRAEQELEPKRKMSRDEQAFSRFKKLVNEHCIRHREIPFYAEKIGITPHYLSMVVSRVSGRTAKYWITRATLVHAKVLLKNKNMPISEVLDCLNFPSRPAFDFYIKRETGLTPRKFREAN